MHELIKVESRSIRGHWRGTNARELHGFPGQNSIRIGPTGPNTSSFAHTSRQGKNAATRRLSQDKPSRCQVSSEVARQLMITGMTLSAYRSFLSSS